MTISLDKNIVVYELAGAIISMTNTEDNFKDTLLEMGFKKEDTRYILILEPEQLTKRAVLIQALIEMDALFVYGKEWSPSEIVEYYRNDLKIISGTYKRIAWKNLNEIVISTE